MNPHRPDPLTQQFSLGFQYAFGPNDVLDVNYVGSRGRRITVGGFNYGQLDPKLSFDGLSVASRCGRSICPCPHDLGLPSNACDSPAGMIEQGFLLEPYPEFCNGASASNEPARSQQLQRIAVNFKHRFGAGTDLYRFLHLLEVPL